MVVSPRDIATAINSANEALVNTAADINTSDSNVLQQVLQVSLDTANTQAANTATERAFQQYSSASQQVARSAFS